MSRLSDEMSASFDSRKQREFGPSGLMRVSDPDTELGPGYLAMREYYITRLTVLVRRGYRQFAGSDLPHDADALLELTSPVMGPAMMALFAQIYSDGVLVGQASELSVKMAFHFGQLDQLFELPDFRRSSEAMAKGFLADDDVQAFIKDYVVSALDALSHLSGFAHTVPDPGKVWDIWLIIGQATLSSAYVAGCGLGQTWAERDTLDGIAIASEGGRNGTEPGHD